MKDKACYGHYRLETAEVKPGLLNSHGLILGVFILTLFPLLALKSIFHFCCNILYCWFICSISMEKENQKVCSLVQNKKFSLLHLNKYQLSSLGAHLSPTLLSLNTKYDPNKIVMRMRWNTYIQKFCLAHNKYSKFCLSPPASAIQIFSVSEASWPKWQMAICPYCVVIVTLAL